MLEILILIQRSEHAEGDWPAFPLGISVARAAASRNAANGTDKS